MEQLKENINILFYMLVTILVGLAVIRCEVISKLGDLEKEVKFLRSALLVHKYSKM